MWFPSLPHPRKTLGEIPPRGQYRRDDFSGDAAVGTPALDAVPTCGRISPLIADPAPYACPTAFRARVLVCSRGGDAPVPDAAAFTVTTVLELAADPETAVAFVSSMGAVPSVDPGVRHFLCWHPASFRAEPMFRHEPVLQFAV